MKKTADHPRMRGEDNRVTSSRYFDFGSPPHARGRLEEFGREVATRRITPACAGKTLGVDI